MRMGRCGRKVIIIIMIINFKVADFVAQTAILAETKVRTRAPVVPPGRFRLAHDTHPNVLIVIELLGFGEQQCLEYQAQGTRRGCAAHETRSPVHALASTDVVWGGL